MKTTVYLDAAAYRRLKRLAESRGGSAAELIRTAVGRYLEEELPRDRPGWIGALESGSETWAQEAEDRLDGFGES